MGCVQAKEAASAYGSRRALDQMKLDIGYDVKGENAARTYVRKDSNKSLQGNGEGEKKISRKSEASSVIGINGRGNVSKRVLANKIDADEMVDGWPKWLVENVPRNVLSGLVAKTADSYDKLAKVGKGTYSNVYKARDKSTGKIVALKKVRFDTSEPRSVQFMAREIITLKKLDHPNIIKLEGIATSRMQYSLYLVFDFMPSDLSKLISQSEGRFTEPQVKNYMQQLLAGLQHCHERGILHRDIKGSNLLIDKNGVLKIADFGLANFYENKPKRPLTSRVVTLWYRAPELLLGCTDYGVGIDLWSAGCLLAEMFVGHPIMPGRNEVEQLHRIFKLCGTPPEDYWKTVKPPATFRITQQYKADFKETFPHIPAAAIGLLGSLLALDPANRGTATSSLHSEFFTTHPLPCDVLSLPVIATEEDDHARSTDRTRNITTKQQSQKTIATHRRKVSFSDFMDTAYARQIRELHMARNLLRLEAATASSSTSSAMMPSNNQETLPKSPTPAFRSQHNRSAKTEAHPNALKNIKNYPLLLASLTEAAHHLEESNSTLYRRTMSSIDFRNLDMGKDI